MALAGGRTVAIFGSYDAGPDGAGSESARTAGRRLADLARRFAPVLGRAGSLE